MTVLGVYRGRNGVTKMEFGATEDRESVAGGLRLCDYVPKE